MLLDKVDVTFCAGNGGNGKVSFKKLGRGPDGGNGGRGGDLYVKASSDLTTLYQFSQKDFLAAENGIPGGDNVKSGGKGDDLTITIPVGTSLVNRDTGQVVLELTEVGQIVKLLKGGDGGKGNWEFRSARNTTPMKAQKGFPGEIMNLTLNLKLIADYGLVGLPNSGKSSLLNELTNSNAKIGNYAFTTLSPNLGVINGKVIADIPGLIEGASEGKGLGINFLKHIEKVKVIVHCIDSTSDDYKRDYKIIRNELKKYNPKMLKKKEVILLTKSDLIKEEEKSKSNSTLFKSAIYVSIHDIESINKIKKILN